MTTTTDPWTTTNTAAHCLGCGQSSLKAFPADEAPTWGYICVHCTENLTEEEAGRLIGENMKDRLIAELGPFELYDSVGPLATFSIEGRTGIKVEMTQGDGAIDARCAWALAQWLKNAGVLIDPPPGDLWGEDPWATPQEETV